MSRSESRDEEHERLVALILLEAEIAARNHWKQMIV